MDQTRKIANFKAKFSSVCPVCSKKIEVGTMVKWEGNGYKVMHENCFNEDRGNIVKQVAEGVKLSYNKTFGTWENKVDGIYILGRMKKLNLNADKYYWYNLIEAVKVQVWENNKECTK